jgi:hypothetical protein
VTKGDTSITLRVLVDHSVVEVYTQGRRIVVTYPYCPPCAASDVVVVSISGPASLHVSTAHVHHSLPPSMRSLVAGPRCLGWLWLFGAACPGCAMYSRDPGPFTTYQTPPKRKQEAADICDMCARTGPADGPRTQPNNHNQQLHYTRYQMHANPLDDTSNCSYQLLATSS